MRCQKCGYVSFDHLAACKSCGVDMTTVRDGLGYLPVEASVPFFLQSLLKGHNDAPLEVEDKAPSRESFASTSPDLELNEVFELDTIELTSGAAELPPRVLDLPADAPPAQKQIKGHLDSALKVLEDIESLDASPGASKAAEPEEELPDLEIDFVLDDDLSFDDEATLGDAPKLPPIPRMPQEVPELTLSEEPEMVSVTMAETISETTAAEPAGDDLDQLALDADWDKDLDLQLELDDAELVQTVGVEKKEMGTKKAGSAEEGFVLELSEDDLESLIIELEDADGEKESGDSGKTSGAGKSPREKA